MRGIGGTRIAGGLGDRRPRREGPGGLTMTVESATSPSAAVRRPVGQAGVEGGRVAVSGLTAGDLRGGPPGRATALPWPPGTGRFPRSPARVCVCCVRWPPPVPGCDPTGEAVQVVIPDGSTLAVLAGIARSHDEQGRRGAGRFCGGGLVGGSGRVSRNRGRHRPARPQPSAIHHRRGSGSRTSRLVLARPSACGMGSPVWSDGRSGSAGRCWRR